MNLENKNNDSTMRNNYLWQELCKAREREQNLEKLLMMAFTCLAHVNGFNIYTNNKDISLTNALGSSGTTCAESSNNDSKENMIDKNNG